MKIKRVNVIESVPRYGSMDYYRNVSWYCIYFEDSRFSLMEGTWHEYNKDYKISMGKVYIEIKAIKNISKRLWVRGAE